MRACGLEHAGPGANSGHTGAATRQSHLVRRSYNPRRCISSYASRRRASVIFV
jgi:hypothetical protein